MDKLKAQHGTEGGCESNGSCYNKEYAELYSQYTAGAIGGTSPGPLVVSAAQKSSNTFRVIRTKPAKPILSELKYADSATSDKAFTRLVKNIRVNGLKDPVIHYADIAGNKYILVGNARTHAARLLGKTNELVFKEVKLPFRSFKTNNDVLDGALRAELGMPKYRGR